MFARSSLAAFAAFVVAIATASPLVAQVAPAQVAPESYLGEIERKQRAIAALQMDIALAELEARKAESLAKRAKSLTDVENGKAALAAASRQTLPAPVAGAAPAPAAPVAAMRAPATSSQVEAVPVRVVSIGGVGQGLTAIVSLPGGGISEIKEKDDLGGGWQIEQISLAGVMVKHGPSGKRDKLAFVR